RFPYGASTPTAITTVNAAGYAAIGWTVDTLGWQGTTEGRSVASVVARVLDAARPGEIVLMHVGAHPEDGSTLDADALPSVIAELRAAGYRFVTLDAVLG
nr:polysaccharide deacetylase family protein [Actinomycetes bacterium]